MEEDVEKENASEQFYISAILMQRALEKIYGLSEAQGIQVNHAMRPMLEGIRRFANDLKHGLLEEENN